MEIENNAFNPHKKSEMLSFKILVLKNFPINIADKVIAKNLMYVLQYSEVFFLNSYLYKIRGSLQQTVDIYAITVPQKTPDIPIFNTSIIENAKFISAVTIGRNLSLINKPHPKV